MKTTKLLAGVAAIAAVLGTAGAANAGTATDSAVGGTNVSIPFLGNVFVPNGALYTAAIGTQNNNGTAATTDGASFTLRGNVTPDCSFYTGNSNSRTLDFGQIGVNVDDNVSPNDAFEMVSGITGNINTNVAGCNTNNRVTVSKGDVRGLVNNAPGGYSAEFAANIPYSVNIQYDGSTTAAAGVTTARNATISTTQSGYSELNGAWRSGFNMFVNAPARTDRALVAGTYQDTLTVTLAVGS